MLSQGYGSGGSVCCAECRAPEDRKGSTRSLSGVGGDGVWPDVDEEGDNWMNRQWRLGRLRSWTAVLTVIGGIALVSPAAQTGRETFVTVREDLGEVRLGGKYEAKFRITNSTKSIFVPGRVLKSCGCTEVSLSRDPIAPGEALEVMVLTEAAGNPYGTWEQDIWILDKTSPSRAARLILSGRFPEDGRLIASPDEIQLGDVVESSTTEYVLRVRRRDGTPVNFQKAEARSKEVRIRVLESAADGVSLALLLSLDAKGLRSGEYMNEIAITTRHPVYREVKVKLVGRIVDDIYCSPSRLFLGRYPARERLSWPVTVLSRSGRAFSIVGASQDLGGQWAVARDDKKLSLRLVPTADSPGVRAGLVRGQVTVKVRSVSSPGIREIAVPVIGRAYGAKGSLLRISGANGLREHSVRSGGQR